MWELTGSWPAVWLLAGDLISLSLRVLIHKMGCQPLRGVVRVKYKTFGTVLDKGETFKNVFYYLVVRKEVFIWGKVYKCEKN